MAASPSPELRAFPLTEQVAGLLKTRILRGELKPGERLVEQRLAKSLGVGQNAVREALIELAHLGYVRRLANRGTYVTKLTLEDAQQLAEVRGALECLAVDRIARRVQRDNLDLTHLDEILLAMREAAQKGDREAFYDHDLRFHKALWAHADNPFLSQMLEQIVVPLFAVFILLYMRKDNAAESFLRAVAAHEKVVEKLKQSAGTEAVDAMRQLVDLALQNQQGLISPETES